MKGVMNISRLVTGALLLMGVLAVLGPMAAPARADKMEVSAFVNKNQVQQGEAVRLSVRVKTGQGDPVVDISPIIDFTPVSSGTSSSMSIINGKVTREQVFTYQLMPKKKGNLTIPALTVTLNGQTARTNPITVEVADRPAGPSDRRDVFVQAEVSHTSVYQGQVMTYRFRLYSAVPIANARLQRPSFAGFSSVELDRQPQYRKVINGREYGVTGITVLLTPINAADILIEPAVLACDVVRRKNPDPGFGFFFSTQSREPVTLQTNPVHIHVKPLPPYTGDAPFSGLVGSFKLTADLSPARVKVGDSATVTLTLSGQGNIMDAAPPGLQLPDSFKTYADEPSEEISKTEQGFFGKKIFKTAAVPTKPGEFRLAPVRLAVFNPQKKGYEVLSAPLPALLAQPGEAPQSVAAYTPSPGSPVKANKGKKVDFTGHDILPVKTGLDALDPAPGPGLGLFLALVFSPAALWLCALTIRRLTKKTGHRPKNHGGTGQTGPETGGQTRPDRRGGAVHGPGVGGFLPGQPHGRGPHGEGGGKADPGPRTG